MRCPPCGSHHIAIVRKGYRPGLGCLGVLLFNWIGLLLGFLGSNDLEQVCVTCGHRQTVSRQGPGCGCTCLTLLLALLLIAILTRLLPVIL